MDNVPFKYAPMQYVLVKAYGLNYSARVLNCKWDGHTRNYNCEFAYDGKIEAREFFEDELECLE